MTQQEFDQLLIKARKQAQKIENMTDEEYLVFRNNLLKRLNKIEQKILNTQNKISKIEQLPQKRNISLSQESLIYSASVAATVITPVVLLHKLYLFLVESINLDVFARAETEQEVANVIITMALLNIIPGIMAGAVNCEAYSKKPFTKIIEKLRTKLLTKQLNKLQDKRLIQEYINTHIKNAREEIELLGHPNTRNI